MQSDAGMNYVEDTTPPFTGDMYNENTLKRTTAERKNGKSLV